MVGFQLALTCFEIPSCEMKLSMSALSIAAPGSFAANAVVTHIATAVRNQSAAAAHRVEFVVLMVLSSLPIPFCIANATGRATGRNRLASREKDQNDAGEDDGSSRKTRVIA